MKKSPAVVVDETDIAADVGCATLDHIPRPWRYVPDDGRTFSLQNPSLLPGDLFECRAKMSHMIVADRCYSDGNRIDDVGRVKPPAKSRLNHCHVDPFLCEISEGHGCCPLEEGAADLFDGGKHLARIEGESFAGDRCPIDSDPFVEMNQMRRGVEADMEAGSGEGRGDHGADGAFAVGSRHMNCREPPVGIAELRKEFGDRLKPQLDAERLEREELIEGFLELRVVVDRSSHGVVNLGKKPSRAKARDGRLYGA